MTDNLHQNVAAKVQSLHERKKKSIFYFLFIWEKWHLAKSFSLKTLATSTRAKSGQGSSGARHPSPSKGKKDQVQAKHAAFQRGCSDEWIGR